MRIGRDENSMTMTTSTTLFLRFPMSMPIGAHTRLNISQILFLGLRTPDFTATSTSPSFSLLNTTPRVVRSPSRDRTDINLPTDTHTGFTKQFLYRLTVRYISAYRFHLLLQFLTITRSGSQNNQITGFWTTCFFAIMSLYALLKSSGPWVGNHVLLEWELGLRLGLGWEGMGNRMYFAQCACLAQGLV